jgi:hypothetical protein
MLLSSPAARHVKQQQHAGLQLQPCRSLAAGSRRLLTAGYRTPHPAVARVAMQPAEAATEHGSKTAAAAADRHLTAVR